MEVYKGKSKMVETLSVKSLMRCVRINFGCYNALLFGVKCIVLWWYESAQRWVVQRLYRERTMG